jgi:hypothetical protein
MKGTNSDSASPPAIRYAVNCCGEPAMVGLEGEPVDDEVRIDVEVGKSFEGRPFR